MRRAFFQRSITILLAAVMTFASAFTVMAAAGEVTTESGRTIIVQRVDLNDANAGTVVTRNYTERWNFVTENT